MVTCTHMRALKHTHTHTHTHSHVLGSSSPTTVTSNVMQSPSSGAAGSTQQTAAQQLVNVPNLTSITQLPSLVYPLNMPTVLAAQGNSVSAGTGAVEAKKLSGEKFLSLSLPLPTSLAPSPSFLMHTHLP